MAANSVEREAVPASWTYPTADRRESGKFEQFTSRTAKPIELGHDHDIASLEGSHKLRELWPIGTRTGFLLAIDSGRASRLERFDLPAVVLP